MTVRGHDDEGTPATATDSHTLTVADTAPSLTVDVAAGFHAGLITTVAGTGVSGYGGDGGPATAAALSSPCGVAADAAGNLFIADYGNNRVRRVDAATGVITTVAGTGVSGYGGDGGPATSAALLDPTGVAVDGAGNLFIADYAQQPHPAGGRGHRGDHHRGRQRQLGLRRGRRPGRRRALNFPQQVAVDAAGQPVRRGHGQPPGPAGGRGHRPSSRRWPGPAWTGTAGTAARPRPPPCLPQGLAVDAAGNLFIADQGNSRIRRVDAATGVITTVAGTGTAGYGGDGGPATDAALVSGAGGVALDAAGNLFIADGGNNRVRRVDAATGIFTTVAGTGVRSFAGTAARPPTPR